MIAARIIAYDGNDWIELDLTEDVKIPINKSIFDILNVNSKTSGYTKTITLPNTEKNSKFFAQAYNINADKLFDVKKGVDVLIYRSNELVFEGAMYLLAINESIERYTYECVCVDKTKDLFDKLSEFTLKDIVPSGTTIYFSQQDIENQSWTNPSTSPNYPVHFVMMDKGYARQNENTNLKNLHPCVFTNWLLEKCCEKVGYTLDTNSIIYNTTDLRFKHFKHLMITGDSSYFELPQSIINGNSLQVNNNTNVQTSNAVDQYGGAVNHKLLADTEILDPGNRWDNINSKLNLNNYSFLVSVDMRGDIELKIMYGSASCATGAPASITVTCSHYLNIHGSYNIASWTNVNHTFTLQYTTGNVATYKTSFAKILQGVAYSQTSPADIYWNVLIGSISASYGLCPAIPAQAIVIQKNSTQIYAYPQSIQGNYSVDLTQILPNMNAADFFKAFIKTFNLFYKIGSDKKVRLEVYDTFFDSTNIIDISKYVDIQNIKQMIVSDYYPRYLYYSFTNDDSYLNKDYKELFKNELYGDYLLDTGFQNKSNKSDYKSIFNYLVPQLADYVEPTNYQLDNLNKKPMDMKPALLYYNGLSVITDPRDSLNVTNDNTINDNTQYFITGMRRPIGSPFWIDKDTNAYTNYLDYAYANDFDLTYGKPKITYYYPPSITQRNIFYSFFYRWIRNFTDKNSVLVETSVAFPIHFPVALNRIYYFDNAYWYLLQVKDWNVNHIELARCVFLKIVDIPQLEFARIPVGGGISIESIEPPYNPTARVLNANSINTNELVVSSIFNSSRTARIGLQIKTYRFDYRMINDGVIINVPTTTIGAQYFVDERFDQVITINLAGNIQAASNQNDNGFIPFPKINTTQNLSITTSSTLTIGVITINLIYI